MKLGFFHFRGAVGHAEVNQGSFRELQSRDLQRPLRNSLESGSPMFILVHLA